MSTLIGYATTILTFFVALGILVIVHEWGHYIVAKIAGVWVEKFSIGFGPKIIGFHKNGTDYRIAPIPLGGYVKLYGQDPLEEAEGDEVKALEIANDPRSFHSKPMLSKLATVFAGPAMNFVLCLLLMPLVFMVGRMQPKIWDEKPVLLDVLPDSPAAKAGLKSGDMILSLGGTSVGTWNDLTTQIALHPEQEVEVSFDRGGVPQNVSVAIAKDQDSKQPMGFMGVEPMYFYANEPVIDSVTPGSPAETAGFQSADRVIRVGDTSVRYWNEMTKIILASEGKPLAVTVLRNGAEKTLSVTAALNPDSKTWQLGIKMQLNPDLYVKKRHGFVESIGLGLQEDAKLFNLTLDILKRLFTGNLSIKYLGGPIQIAKATSSAAQSGFGEFIYLLAFLSMQLGVLNLLPVPVLDGGHVLFMLIEAIRQKPTSPKVRQVATQIGMAMLLGLMLVVTFNDINSIVNFGHLFQSFRQSIGGMF